MAQLQVPIAVVNWDNVKNYMENHDIVEVVRCNECKHRPIDTGGHNYGQELDFPDDVCPCRCGDMWYSWMPKDNWFCANGERSEDGET